MRKFPVTPSIAWGNTIEPKFKTVIQTSENGLRKTLRKWIYPEYRLTCEFKVLTEDAHALYNDLDTIMGFFMEMGGRAEPFLWKDPKFNRMERHLIGTGNDKDKTFQLTRQVGAFIEPVLDVEDIDIEGTHIAYTINEFGQVVFNSPIPKGKQIYASYTYYWRVAFASDKLQFQNFYKNLWSLKKMELVTVK